MYISSIEFKFIAYPDPFPNSPFKLEFSIPTQCFRIQISLAWPDHKEFFSERKFGKNYLTSKYFHVLKQNFRVKIIWRSYKFPEKFFMNLGV